MAKGTTLRRLAGEGLVDFDEALLRVWEAGLDHVDDIDQDLSPNQASQVRSALGLPSVNEMRSVSYWLDVLSLDRAEFTAMLRSDVGVNLSPNARNLPKGCLSRLRRRFAEQQSNHALTSGAASRSPAPSSPSVGRVDPVEWRYVGRQVEPQYLEVDDVLHVHEALTLEFETSNDPIDPPGVRDCGLLESAVHRCRTGSGDELKYPTPEMASAALLYGVAHDHAFYNGNKRTALVAMLSMLDKNGVTLTCTQDELFKFVLRFAQHKFSAAPGSPDPDRETLVAADWICDNARQVERGERPLKWRELKRQLRRYGVEWESTNVGNRIKLTRVRTRRTGWFSRRDTVHLTTVTHYADDGREVQRNQLNDIRHKLQLTEEFGVDSAAFYADETELDQFIATYRKILYRLAKL